jgi:hypothetical protein
LVTTPEQLFLRSLSQDTLCMHGRPHPAPHLLQHTRDALLKLYFCLVSGQPDAQNINREQAEAAEQDPRERSSMAVEVAEESMPR